MELDRSKEGFSRDGREKGSTKPWQGGISGHTNPNVWLPGLMFSPPAPDSSLKKILEFTLQPTPRQWSLCGRAGGENVPQEGEGTANSPGMEVTPGSPGMEVTPGGVKPFPGQVHTKICVQVVTLKTLKCEASPPLLSPRSCISIREAAADSKSFLREINQTKKGFKKQRHSLRFPGVSPLLALQGEPCFLICANTKFIFVWAIMCKIMGNPSGWSGKPSQIFRETFPFRKVSEISTIQTHKGIQLCVNKLLLQPPPQKTQLDWQQDCFRITWIRPCIRRLRKFLFFQEFHFFPAFPSGRTESPGAGGSFPCSGAAAAAPRCGQSWQQIKGGSC